ncbi:MAG: hypothetical protein ACODAC_09750 [Pseudomonadota bacterium]
MIEVREASFGDALALASRLRFEDAREIADAWGLGAREGLFCCLLDSDRACCVALDGEPVALWGVRDGEAHEPRVGFPWLLASETFFRQGRRLVLECRHWIDALLLDYDVLTNVTDARNRGHLRWLGWCGFTLLRVVEPRSAGEPRRVEFHRVNDRCRLPSSALHMAVLERSQSRGLPGPLVTLARAGVEALGAAVLEGSRSEVRAALLERIQALVRSGGVASDEPAATVPTRSVRWAFELVVEVATHTGGLAHSGPAGGAPAFCALLARLHRLCALAPGPGLPALLLEPRSGQEQRPGRGTSAIDALARRCVRQLTFSGRVSRLQGYRLRTAAVVPLASAPREPLGLRWSVLEAAVQEHCVATGIRGGASPSLSAVCRPHAQWLSASLGHADAVARLRGAFPGGCALARVLDSVLDAWCAGDSGGAAVRNRAGAVVLASAVADRMALRLLPAPRLGWVVGGYADRHRLYRVLRAALLMAALGNAGVVANLLLRDLVGLLAADRFEWALVTGPATDWETQLARAVAAAADLFGPGPAMMREPDRLAELLLPAVTPPGVAPAQVPAALLAWYLAAAGRAGDDLGRLSDLVAEEAPGPRPRLRKFLRRLGRDVNIVEVQRRLDPQTRDDTGSTAPGGAGGAR